MAILVGACVMVFAAAVYWVALLNSHSYLRSYTQDQAWVRVTQMSRAIAAHVGSMFSGLDYTLRDLARDYETGERSSFLRGVQALQTTYPSGTVVQVAVADAQGRVVYSSLNTSEHPPEVVSIDDREHFQAHLKASHLPVSISGRQCRAGCLSVGASSSAAPCTIAKDSSRGYWCFRCRRSFCRSSCKAFMTTRAM